MDLSLKESTGKRDFLNGKFHDELVYGILAQEYLSKLSGNKD
jgi:hypothetical protein